jgi:hypothetical protein
MLRNQPNEGGDMNATNFARAGNLIARSRRDALRILADGRPHSCYRLALIGERMLAAFDSIDVDSTLDERLMLIDANPADARRVEIGQDSMLHLLFNGLEWSAQRRRDDCISFESAPIYWAVAFSMLGWLRSDEAAPVVDAVMRDTFGADWPFGDRHDGGEP